MVAATSPYLVPPRADWFAYQSDADGKSVLKKSKSSHVSAVEAEAIGIKALAEDARKFAKDQGLSTSDSHFLKTILRGGTLTDRISALTLLVQQSAVHNLRALEQLVAMTKKSNRREQILAIDAIKDLLTGGGINSSTAPGLLPSNRKLHYFVDLYALKGAKSGEDERMLALFCFEDRLKKLYFELVALFEALLYDPLPHIRLKLINIVFELLVTKPEQESNLLKLLINKLGDSERKVTSKAVYLLDKLVTEHHPAMKLVVIKTIEEFMGRTNVGSRALYYATITLNQILLSPRERHVAIHLIDMYFSLFYKLSGARHRNGKPNKRKRGANATSETVASPIDTKIMSALLTGINRAYPFTSLITKSGGLVPTSSHSDTDTMIDDVMDKHMDTLFRITHIGTFGITVQALVLIYQVTKNKEYLADRFYRALYATILDPRVGCSSKHHTLYLNLLFKALKSDPQIQRVQAFAKRILQLLSGERNVGFVIGCLWMLSEVMRHQPGIWNMISMPEENSDNVEHFKDVDCEDEIDDDDDANPAMLISKPSTTTSGTYYDPTHRNPTYAKASTSCLWEILPLLHHYHPTVQVYVQSLLQSQAIPIPEGVDPLETFTLVKFLEKYVYRNPKKIPKMGPQAKLAGTIAKNKRGVITVDSAAKANRRVTEMLMGSRVPLNSDEFLSKEAEEVPIEERFFYQYFKTRSERRERPLDKPKKLDEDINGFDESDGDFSESEVERAIMSSGVGKVLHDSDVDEEDDDVDMGLDSNDDMEMEVGSDSDEERERSMTKVHDNGMDDEDEDEDELAAVFAEEDDMSDNEIEMDHEQDNDSDGFDSEEERAATSKKSKKGDKNSKKLGFSLSASPFASAEQFSRMMESNEGLDDPLDVNLDTRDGIASISAATAVQGDRRGKRDRKSPKHAQRGNHGSNHSSRPTSGKGGNKYNAQSSGNKKRRR